MTQRQVGCGHVRWVLFAHIVGIHNHVLWGHIFGTPLNGAGWACNLLPFVLEQHLEVAHVPLRGVGLPSAFKITGGGVCAVACAMLVFPSQAHLFNGCAFWLRTKQGGIAGAVHFAKGVTASNQGHRFVVIHRHTGECLTHIFA